MTNKELKKYFDRRPSIDVLYVVDGVVFIDEPSAAHYAAMLKKVMETHNRNDEDAPADEFVIGEPGETVEVKAEIEAEIRPEAEIEAEIRPEVEIETEVNAEVKPTRKRK